MASAESSNSASKSNTQSDDQDPVENMIKKTGCMDVHYKVQVQNCLPKFRIKKCVQ